MPTKRRIGRKQPPGQHNHRHADRDIDEEHQPPALVRSAERNEATADQRPQGGTDADRRSQDAESPATLGAGKQLLHQARYLRVDQAAGQPLQHPRPDQHTHARR